MRPATRANRRLPGLLGLLLALVVLAGCATAPRVYTDFDPAADFSRYRSYAFHQPLAMEESGYSTYLTETIKAGIRREMDARGYVFDAGNPDLRVNFQGVIRERIDVYTIPRSDPYFFYGYRARAYFPMPLWYDETQVRHYTEGTLTIDVVDAGRKHLVWTGAAIGRVTQKTPQERAVEANRAVTAIFERYPYSVGSAGSAQR